MTRHISWAWLSWFCQGGWTAPLGVRQNKWFIMKITPWPICGSSWRTVWKAVSFFFNCCSSTVVCIFSPPLPPHPSHPRLPPLIPPCLGFVHVSFIVVPENPSSPPRIIPSHLPDGYCQLVLKAVSFQSGSILRVTMGKKSQEKGNKAYWNQGKPQNLAPSRKTATH